MFLPKDRNFYVHYQNVQEYDVIIKACDEVLDQYEGLLVEAVKSGKDVSDRVTIQTRKGAIKFDYKKFAQMYPEIYKEFTSTIIEIKGTFRYATSKEDVKTLAEIDLQISEFIAEYKELMEIDVVDEELEFIFHDKSLQVKAFKKFAEWKQDIADAKLRSLTGLNDGIEGICTWKRAESTKTTFDKEGAKASYLQEYHSCEYQAADTEAVIIEGKAGYKS